MHRLAVFASGTGSNARELIHYFSDHPSIRVVLVVSNRPEAPVLNMAAEQGVSTLLLQRREFYQSDALLEELRRHDVTFIVLAGFLWLIPAYLITAFPQRIINIHPALLPAYGGKGMFGMHVHQAVHAARERESGVTIHYVDEHYDQGRIIFQARCPVTDDDTPETIARKVQQLEHRHFGPVIEQLLTHT